MSTRANIVFKDESTTLFFYRHSDGYPEGCGADLREFVKGYASFLRANVMQSAGHLIVRGHEEYKNDMSDYNKWKVGAYEPTDMLHFDVEFIYVIDLEHGILETRIPSHNKDFWDNPTLESTSLIESSSFKMVNKL